MVYAIRIARPTHQNQSRLPKTNPAIPRTTTPALKTPKQPTQQGGLPSRQFIQLFDFFSLKPWPEEPGHLLEPQPQEMDRVFLDIL
jgi:hypothetical protein